MRTGGHIGRPFVLGTNRIWIRPLLTTTGERMKNINRISLIVVVLMLLTACGPKIPSTPVFEGDNPYAPQAGDSDLMTGEITVDSASLVLAKSQPPQVMVNFAYFQPTPCY